MSGSSLRPAGSRRRTPTTVLGSLLGGLATLAFVVFAVFPQVWMLVSSFRPATELFVSPPTLMPGGFTLDWYIEAFLGSDALRWFANSLIIAVATSVIACTVGTLAGYALSRYVYPGRRWLMLLLTSAYLFPAILLLMPLYLMLANYRLIGTLPAIVLAHLLITLPLATWLMKSFVDAVPRELEEAALVDGCGPFRAFFKVTFPLLRTGLAHDVAVLIHSVVGRVLVRGDTEQRVLRHRAGGHRELHLLVRRAMGRDHGTGHAGHCACRRAVHAAAAVLREGHHRRGGEGMSAATVAFPHPWEVRLRPEGGPQWGPSHAVPRSLDAGEVRLRFLAGGICGSDIGSLAGVETTDAPSGATIAPLHEVVAAVVESRDERFEPDQVVVGTGLTGLASELIEEGVRLIPVPPGFSVIEAVAIQPVATVIRAVAAMPPVAGRDVVVIGAGAIGLAFVHVLRSAGARSVVAVDPVQGRAELARHYGATDFIPSTGQQWCGERGASPPGRDHRRCRAMARDHPRRDHRRGRRRVRARLRQRSGRRLRHPVRGDVSPSPHPRVGPHARGLAGCTRARRRVPDRAPHRLRGLHQPPVPGDRGDSGLRAVFVSRPVESESRGRGGPDSFHTKGTFMTIDTDPSALAAAAAVAHLAWSRASRATRAEALTAVADALDASDDRLIALAQAETHLDEARLRAELRRTTFQLRLFAEVLIDGGYLDVRVDQADRDWPMGARPDIRRTTQAIGPIVVYAASNFPFAFSVAGGDTASALAAGSSVIVKAHAGHPQLSRLTASIVVGALRASAAPEGLFALVESRKDGIQLLRDPRIKAGSFTGSIPGGRALFDIAVGRPDPIPFFGELGSVNPVFVTARADSERGEAIAAELLQSVTLGSGQFCTKPGLVLVPERAAVVDALRASQLPDAHAMLNERIHEGYVDELRALMESSVVEVLAQGSDPFGASPSPTVLLTRIADLLANPDELVRECFGPTVIIATYGDESELLSFAGSLDGQLTATIVGNEDDASVPPLLDALREKAGRLLWNQWPTGVSVTYAQHHGGPYPATTAPQSTSVGTAAIARFLRPLAFQGFPQSLLPDELRDVPGAGLVRRLNGSPEHIG